MSVGQETVSGGGGKMHNHKISLLKTQKQVHVYMCVCVDGGRGGGRCIITKCPFQKHKDKTMRGREGVEGELSRCTIIKFPFQRHKNKTGGGGGGGGGGRAQMHHHKMSLSKIQTRP